MTNEKTGKPNWLNFAGILWIGIGLVSILPAGFLFVFFDHPSPNWNANNFYVFSLISFPIVCIGTGIGIWFVKNKHKTWFLMLPVLPIIFFFAAQVWMNMSSCAAFDLYHPFDCHIPTLQEQGNATNVGKCALPVVDGGDGLKTTGCGVLEVGVTVTGIINSTSEAHNWEFPAQNGDDTFLMTIENDGKSCLGFIILDSSGNIIKALDYEPICPIGTNYTFFSPPTTGTYILRLITPESPGAYWVKIRLSTK